MPETTDIFDTVIGILRRQKARGRRTLDLPLEARERLFPKAAPPRRRGSPDARDMRRMRSAVTRATSGRQSRTADAPPPQPAADVAGLEWGPLEQHVAG